MSSTKPKNFTKTFSFWLIAFYFIFIVLCVALFKTPAFVLTIYLVMSLVTYFVYRKDKNAAISQTWRVSEKILHCLSLLCGWPGALYAIHSLKHKSQKTSFKIILWGMIFINISAFMWIFTTSVAQFFTRLFMNILDLF